MTENRGHDRHVDAFFQQSRSEAASARWADGARLEREHTAQELIDRERNAARRRLGDIRH